MEEGDALAVGSRHPAPMQEAEAPCSEVLQRGVEIVDGETDVVDAAAAAGEKLRDGRVLRRGLEKLDAAFSHGKKRRSHFLGGNLLPMRLREPERAINVERVVNGDDCNADVIDPVCG